MVTWEWVTIKAPKGAKEKSGSGKNGENRMVWEERILYFSTFQFLHIVPEYASFIDVEVGSGFQEYVHRLVSFKTLLAWITLEVIRHTIKWLGSDKNGFLSIVLFL